MSCFDVSIVFVNYNTKKLIINAINSVFEKTEGVNFEIIVVDNASIDGSIEALKNDFGNRIRIIESRENLGFGRANNLAIKQANSKYIFLLNTDTLLMNNAIKILFDFMEQNSNIGVAGGNLYNAQGNPTHSFGPKLLKPENAFLNVFKYHICKCIKQTKIDDFNYSKMNKKVGFITGADMFIRKIALEASGLFDEDFFMYFEETELTSRLTKNGWFSYSVPSAKISHLEYGSQGGTVNESTIKLYKQSEYLYYEKVFGKYGAKRHFQFKLQIEHLSFFVKFFNFKNYRRPIETFKNKYQMYKKNLEQIKNEYRIYESSTGSSRQGFYGKPFE